MTPAGRRFRNALGILALLDVATTALCFRLGGATVEGNPVLRAMVPVVGAYGMLVLVLVLAKLPLAHAMGRRLSQRTGRQAVAYALPPLALMSLVVLNNTAALYIFGRTV